MTTIRLAGDFKARGAECLLVVPAETPLAENGRLNGLRIEFLKPRMKYGDLLAARRLARILRSHRIEVALLLRSQDIHLAAAATRTCPQLKLAFYQQMQSGVNKRDLLHTWMYSKLSLWVTLTERMKKDVLLHTRLTEDRVQVVPLGRDTRQFDPARFDQTACRKMFDLPPDAIIVGMAARLDPQKGQEEFLRAIPRVQQRRLDVLFVIVGEETRGEEGYKKRLVDLSRELGVGDRVRFLPHTDRVAEFIAAVDLFALPSYSETYGLVLIEAMAMEKPVVATNAGGVPEIIEHGRDGLLVPPRDAGALAEALITLLENPPLRFSLSTEARRSVLRRFDSSLCVDRLVAALDSI